MTLLYLYNKTKSLKITLLVWILLVTVSVLSIGVEQVQLHVLSYILSIKDNIFIDTAITVSLVWFGSLIIIHTVYWFIRQYEKQTPESYYNIVDLEKMVWHSAFENCAISEDLKNIYYKPWLKIKPIILKSEDMTFYIFREQPNGLLNKGILELEVYFKDDVSIIIKTAPKEHWMITNPKESGALLIKILKKIDDTNKLNKLDHLDQKDIY